MKVNRHGKPSKAYTSMLRGPTSADYDELVAACVEAVINGSEDVLVAFAYTLKFPRGFPKGILTEKQEHKNIHRVKARKLLRWLCDNGHTGMTMEDLTGHIIRWGLYQKRLEEDLAI